MFQEKYNCDPPQRDLMGIAEGIDPGQPAQVDHSGKWQIFCLLIRLFSDNSTKLNCHFEIIELHWPVHASFLSLFFLSRSSNKVPFCVMGHILLLMPL